MNNSKERNSTNCHQAQIHSAHRVFIVDDHPIFCEGLTRLIEREEDLTVAGLASTASEALEALRKIQTDVATVDISLPGMDGIELIKHLVAEHPNLPILAISAHDEHIYGLRAIRAGALGYLMKDEGGTLLCTALRAVLAGDVWVSPGFGQKLIYRVACGLDSGQSPLDVLTDRELEVLRAIGSGKSSKDIANFLNLSVKTIETHRLHIKEKLGLESSSEVVRFALEWIAYDTNQKPFSFNSDQMNSKDSNLFSKEPDGLIGAQHDTGYGLA